MTSIERLIQRAGGPNSVETVFDVGAHDGADSLPIAERYPNIYVVAIEPTPGLAAELHERSVHLANYTVVKAAVSTVEGERELNVFDRNPNLNSLNRLHDDAAARVGRRSGDPDARPLVTAKRLSTICDTLGITTIDVLHVDTQGSDLEVLRSLDPARLRSVRAGVIEVSYRRRNYDASQDGRQARAALTQLGFRVFRIERMYFDTDSEHNYFFAPRNPRHRSPVLEQVAFESHLLAAEVRAAYMRYGGRSLQKLRVNAAVGTRLRSMGRG